MKSKYVVESANDLGRKKECLHNRAAEGKKKSLSSSLFYFLSVYMERLQSRSPTDSGRSKSASPPPPKPLTTLSPPPHPRVPAAVRLFAYLDTSGPVYAAALSAASSSLQRRPGSIWPAAL